MFLSVFQPTGTTTADSQTVFDWLENERVFLFAACVCVCFWFVLLCLSLINALTIPVGRV